MKELIKITEQSGRQAVSARELYAFLSGDIEMRHVNEWMNRNIENNQFAVQNADYQRIPLRGENGRIKEDFAVSIDFAKELSMMSKCERGKEARLYFIECERRLESNHPALPKTYAEALRLAADQAEKIEEQQKAIEEAKPKVALANAISETNGAITMGEFAKLIYNETKMGRNALFKWLRDNKVLNANNIPYQRYVEYGWFKLVENVWSGKQSQYVNIQTLVTGKGQIGLLKQLQKL